MILLPGLVDTHNHLWLSAARGQFRNTPDTDYFALKKRLGRHYTPDDVRIGTYVGAIETLASGVTTTVDFFHNLRSPAHLEAAEQALLQSGIRARLLAGAHDDLGPAESVDLDLL
ncbi:hydrolase, partial [Pseudomonas syringae pv. pisi]